MRPRRDERDTELALVRTTAERIRAQAPFWPTLTATQATPNADGRYTFVISRTDPGTPNWLDPVDHDHGLLFIRWQGLTGPLAPEDAPRMTLAPTTELADALPPRGTQAVPADRSARIAERTAELRARFNGLPTQP